MANLEEISADCAVVLLDEEPSLGSPISLSVKDHDLFGVVKARVCDATLGWFAIVGLDAASRWNRDWFSPKHLLHVCECYSEDATEPKVQTLDNTRNTEENVPVNFVSSEA